jgi:signal transduction histidine kinase
MRRRLAWLALAITSLVVIAFIVPLMLVVRRQAIERAQIDAERAVQTVASLVALAAAGTEVLSANLISNAVGGLPEEVAVLLPDASTIGDVPPTSSVVGSVRLGLAASGYNSDGDWEVGVPIQTRHGVIGVVATAPAAKLSQGVATAWLVLAGLGLLVIGAAVALALRLGRELVRPVGELARVADRLGQGDLSARATGEGPPELTAVAAALNGLAGRLGDLIKAERESLADLSHRLRTPLTSLRLQGERLTDEAEKASVLAAVDRMQAAVDGMIAGMRQGKAPNASVDLADLVRRRLEFWGVLAAEQGRKVNETLAPGPILVSADEDELGSMLDSLVGNVLAHTAGGVPFEVRLVADQGRAVLTVGDGGPGFPAGVDAASRGVSGAGSTGLGLDIARRVAERAGGSMRLGRSPLGGAQVEVTMKLGREA